MRRCWLAGLSFLIACAPPDPVDLPTATESGEPEVELLFPSNGTAMEVDPDTCTFSQLFVASVRNFDLTDDQSTEEDPTGRSGHFHLYVNDSYITADAQASTFDKSCQELGAISAEGPAEVSVQLHASNTHEPLDQWDKWFDVNEVSISDPGGCLRLADPCAVATADTGDTGSR